MLTYKNFKIGTKFRFRVPSLYTFDKYDFTGVVSKIRVNKTDKEWGIEYINAKGIDGRMPAELQPDKFISNFEFVTIIETPKENYKFRAKNGTKITCSIKKK